jgi:hypothetical protein
MSEWVIVESIVAASRRDSEHTWQALHACPMVAVFTDGSAPLSNPGGPAGFAAIGCTLRWIKGHAGAQWNEEADVLATRAALEFNEQRYAALRATQAVTGR